MPQQRISIVVAAARNGVIGAGNQLPWRLPADLQRFKALTLGKPVIMGRLTFESIGRPLPNRTNIVISRQPVQLEGCLCVNSIEAALSLVSSAAEVMVIGGAQIYAHCLDRCTTIHLTRVHADIEGDTYFPALPPGQWDEQLIEHHEADARHAQAFSFLELTRSCREPMPLDELVRAGLNYTQAMSVIPANTEDEAAVDALVRRRVGKLKIHPL